MIEISWILDNRLNNINIFDWLVKVLANHFAFERDNDPNHLVKPKEAKSLETTLETVEGIQFYWGSAGWTWKGDWDWYCV